MTTPTDAKMALTFHFVLASFLFGSVAYADAVPPDSEGRYICRGTFLCPPSPNNDGYDQDFTVPKTPRCESGWMLVYFPHTEIQMCARELRVPQ